MAGHGKGPGRWPVLVAVLGLIALAVLSFSGPPARTPDRHTGREVEVRRRRPSRVVADVPTTQAATPGATITSAVPGATTTTTTTTSPPAVRSPASPGGGGTPGTTRPEEPRPYVWSLPAGDVSPDDFALAYNELAAGCSRGRAFLDGEVADPGKQGLWPPWRVRLFEAGIAVCFGELEGARSLLPAAGLTDHAGDCLIYKAALSVLDQVPPSAVTCPTPRGPIGEAPPEMFTADGRKATSAVNISGGDLILPAGPGE